MAADVNSRKGYVIRCHDLFDGSTHFRGLKGIFAETKAGFAAGDTYSLSGAKRAISNMNRLSFDPDRYQYSIERLDSFYIPTAPKESRRDKAELIEHAMRRLDELTEGNSFHNGDKMRINEVKHVLRVLKEEQ